MWQPHDLGYSRAWVFQHNVMELCTGVKGRALQRLMQDESDADLFVYLDPDVYVYNDLAAADGYLGDSSIDRKSVVWGKSGSVRVDLGGSRIIKKKQNI